MFPSFDFPRKKVSSHPPTRRCLNDFLMLAHKTSINQLQSLLMFIHQLFDRMGRCSQSLTIHLQGYCGSIITLKFTKVINILERQIKFRHEQFKIIFRFRPREEFSPSLIEPAKIERNIFNGDKLLNILKRKRSFQLKD